MVITIKPKQAPNLPKGDTRAWIKVVKYNYYWHDNGEVKIDIHTEGTGLFRCEFTNADVESGTNLLQMLRFHDACEFKYQGPYAFRALGRQPGTGSEILPGC